MYFNIGVIFYQLFICFRRLGRLVSSLRQRAPRIELVKLVQALSNHKSLKAEPSLVKLLNVFADLESFDKRHLEDPDYERRFEALAVMSRMYNDKKEYLDPLGIVFLIRSHAFAISTTSDIALRAAATGAFHDLAVYISKYFSKDPNIRQELLKKHLIQLISNGIRSSKENVRDDFVKALDVLVVQFSEDEQHLKSLKSLKNENLDEDFFLNIVHIQQYKRTRALKSLGDRLADKSLEIPIGCLTKFILPMIKPYLVTVEQKLLPLSDCALKVFTEILKLTSWKRYENLLEMYVGRLEKEENSKPIVRIITAIIDGFHFDLSGCKLEQKEFMIGVNPKKRKRRLGTKIFNKNLNEEKKDESENEDEDEVDENAEDNADENTEQKEDPKVILEAMMSTILPELKKCLKPSVSFVLC